MVALFFSETTGNVLINQCDFFHNNQHTGHGAAIQYTTEAKTPTMTRLVINRCNFSYNGAAKSIVYISGSGKNHFHAYKIQRLLGTMEYLFTFHNKGYILKVMCYSNTTRASLEEEFLAGAQQFYLRTHPVLPFTIIQQMLMVEQCFLAILEYYLEKTL